MDDFSNPENCRCQQCLASGGIPHDANHMPSWGPPPPPPVQTNIVNHYYGLHYNIHITGTSALPDTVQMLQQAQQTQLLPVSQPQIAVGAVNPAEVAPSGPPDAAPLPHVAAPLPYVAAPLPQVAAPLVGVPLPESLGLQPQFTASPAQTALPGPPEIQGEIGNPNQTSQHQQQGERSEIKRPLPFQPITDKAGPSSSSSGSQTYIRPVEPQQSNNAVTETPVQNVDDSENGPVPSVPNNCDVDTVAKLILRDGNPNSARYASFLQYLAKSVPEAADVVLGLHSNIMAAKIQEAKLQQITTSSLDAIFMLIPSIFAETYAAWMKVGMLNYDINDSTHENSVTSDKEGSTAEIQRQTCAIEGYNHQWDKTEVSLPFPKLGKRALDTHKRGSTSASTNKVKPGKDKRERLVEVLKMKAGKAEDGHDASILLQFYEGANSIEAQVCSSIAEVARNKLQLLANQWGDENFIREFNDAFKSENKENEDASTVRTLCGRGEGTDESEPSTIHEGQSTSVKTKNVKDESKKDASGNVQGTTKKRKRKYGYGWSKPLPETPEKKRCSARVTRSSSSKRSSPRVTRAVSYASTCLDSEDSEDSDASLD